MPRPHLYLCFAVSLAVLILVACDSPTAPRAALFPNFELIEDTASCRLSAADRTVGGAPPFSLRWTSTGQPETTDVSPSWQYQVGQIHEITVRLHVTDSANTVSTVEKETTLDCT